MRWFPLRKKAMPIDYPPYWTEYVKCFDEPLSQGIAQTRFVAFDTETTGLNVDEDRILSLGCIPIEQQTILVNDILEIYVEQQKFNPETVKVHGIIKNHTLDKLTEEEAIVQFLKFIKNSVLVGHHIAFDIAMINEVLKRHELPGLKNPRIDTERFFSKLKIVNYVLRNERNYALEDLCDELSISQDDRHTATGDAYITAIAFLKILSRVNKTNTLTLRQLLGKG